MKNLFFLHNFKFKFYVFLTFLGIPIIRDFYISGLVDKLPSAILAGLLSVLSFLCFFSGLILDVIKKLDMRIKE